MRCQDSFHLKTIVASWALAGLCGCVPLMDEPPFKCNTDSDCPKGEVCQESGEYLKKVCVAAESGEKTNTEGQSCDSNFDCSVALVCSIDTYLCVDKYCRSDSECPEAYFCDQNNSCYRIECATSSDCPVSHYCTCFDGAVVSCASQYRYCKFGCQYDSDCMQDWFCDDDGYCTWTSGVIRS